jgi:hypothetical protein
MPLENLLGLPLKYIENLISAEVKTNPEGIYDRKKAIEMLADYIGLLHESILTNHAILYISNSYGEASYG